MRKQLILTVDHCLIVLEHDSKPGTQLQVLQIILFSPEGGKGGVKEDYISTSFDDDDLNSAPAGFNFNDGVNGRSDLTVAGGPTNGFVDNNYLYWNASGLKKRASRKLNAPPDFASMTTSRLSKINNNYLNRY